MMRTKADGPLQDASLEGVWRDPDAEGDSIPMAAVGSFINTDSSEGDEPSTSSNKQDEERGGKSTQVSFQVQEDEVPSSEAKPERLFRVDPPVNEDRRANLRDYRCALGKSFIETPAVRAAYIQGEDDMEDEEFDASNTKAVFHHAYRYIHPGKLFRLAVYMYGERKMLVFFLCHFVATMVIWSHFALVKWEEQSVKVPEGAPYFWWKRIAPPLEFGSMHAILFQMALIPLTMSRFTIASLTESFVERFVPLNRAVRMHIHLGYVMVGIVFLATVFFFIFFGILCAGEQEAFCQKFTSEIMCTGYGILASLLIIGGTSYFRYNIPYELFYIIHHLVFAMYIITIMHTFDHVHRDGQRNRSQTFKWFSAPLLYYVCDRAAMHMNHRYRVQVVSSSAVVGIDGSRMLHITIRRPLLFHFKPGQYAFLRHPSIDIHWHPFSIASNPSSDFLEFYIEIFDDKSWTAKLWDVLGGSGKGGVQPELKFMEIMGPYGTSLGRMDGYSHCIAIGAGTGIVPVFSILKEHVRELLKLSPEVYKQTVEENRQDRLAFELATEAHHGSIATRISKSFTAPIAVEELNGLSKNDFLRELQSSNEVSTSCTKRHTELRQASDAATKSIYSALWESFVTGYGLMVFGLTLSWNTIPIDIYHSMPKILQTLTIIFQVIFAVPAIFSWNGHGLQSFVDVAIVLCMVPADWYWHLKYREHNQLPPVALFALAFFLGYMTFRFWARVVGPRTGSWQQAAQAEKNRILDRLEVVWVSRSAPSIIELLPEMNQLWEKVVEHWGPKEAEKVCRISVYCSDESPAARNLLEREISEMLLYKQGLVRYGRPNFGEMVENHTLEVVDESKSSNTLLVFCGAPRLAEKIHHCKISNDIVTAITGNKKHQMEFVSESYGGISKAKKKKMHEINLQGDVSGKNSSLSQQGTSSRKLSVFADDGVDSVSELKRLYQTS